MKAHVNISVNTKMGELIRDIIKSESKSIRSFCEDTPLENIHDRFNSKRY